MRYPSYLDKRFHIFSLLLLWVALIFLTLTAIRRLLYHVGILKKIKVSVPVIIVGNITAGGAGKSPLVIALVQHLKQQGYRPGVISRGYGGNRDKNSAELSFVTIDSDPFEVGDEPVMLARACKCPVAISSDKVNAAQYLIDHSDCNVIIADDGLQHYRLARDIEIVVVDAHRKFGNGFLLPAGPLRELPSRLKSVDFVVINGETSAVIDPDQIQMSLKISGVCSLDGDISYDNLDKFKGQSVYAVAGIGNPARFFELLEESGLKSDGHPFADHHIYTEADFKFTDSDSDMGTDTQTKPIFMTRKDAVKCEKLKLDNVWVVDVAVEVDQALFDGVLRLLEQ